MNTGRFAILALAAMVFSLGGASAQRWGDDELFDGSPRSHQAFEQESVNPDGYEDTYGASFADSAETCAKEGTDSYCSGQKVGSKCYKPIGEDLYKSGTCSIFETNEGFDACYCEVLLGD